MNSLETRQALDNWFKNSDYNDIKFWVSPNSNTSQEGAEAELWECIQEFEKQKFDGTLVLTPILKEENL